MTDLSSPVLRPAPEAKSLAARVKAAGDPAVDVASAFDDFMRTFETYKAQNDHRLIEMEKRVGVDVITTDKLDRIGAALDEHKRLFDQWTLRQARPGLGNGAPPLVNEHKAAFEAYVRGGADHGLKRLEEKALSQGSGPDGGYLVPSETETEILRRLSKASPIRAIAGNRQVTSAVYKKPFSVTGPATGWVGETAARPQTDSPVLAELSFPAMELYAMPAATATLLDDAAVNIDQWIAEEVEQAFAEQEGAAFINGDGINKPKGFLAYDMVAEASWAWTKIGYLATGVAGALPASNPSDKLIDLVYTLKAGYRQNASFVMNRKTQAEIRKLKDADGNYLWAPPSAIGQPATLMNFPLVEAEDMPVIAANSHAIAFGDFNRGYLIVDRLGVRVLRDPYSSKPYVLFYTTKRVGGGVQDFDAIKTLKFGVS